MLRKDIRSSFTNYFLIIGVLGITVLSFWSLDLQLSRLISWRSLELMAKFFNELLSPNLSSPFLSKILVASLETIAMSAVGTLVAAILGIMLALPASKTNSKDPAFFRTPARWLLNALRSIPELVWAALLLISVGLGPFAGTLALGLHTAGVLGRLFAESIENANTHSSESLRLVGVSEFRIFLYATLPTVLPQLISYTLYRWENNIRAAAVLGIVGGGGLGQMLAFHMGLFQMEETSTILLSMIGLVIMVDALSYWLRKSIER